MKRLIIALFCIGSIFFASPSLAAGDAAAGEAKAIVCSACHGADGNSNNPEWPSLAGQHERYTTEQLKAFKEGARSNVLMGPQAMMLSDQDMADLGAWFATRTASATAADPAVIETGERLYRVGDKKRGISACAACHGPKGRGNGPAGIPAIAGQKNIYFIAQLKAYADESRKGSSEIKTSMMHLVASHLSQEDMDALAGFVGALQ